MIIKEHKDTVVSLIQLISGELVSGSKEIIIFKIKDLQYEILQRLKDNTNYVLKIIELKKKI